MELILQLEIAARAKCPIIGVPFEDGSKLILSRVHLLAALEAPTLEAVLTERGVRLFSGDKVVYNVTDLRKDKKYTGAYSSYGGRVEQGLQEGHIRGVVNKWAESQRKNHTRKAANRNGTGKLLDHLRKLEREMRKSFGKQEPQFPVNPMLQKCDGYGVTMEEWAKWKGEKHIRKGLSRLLARKDKPRHPSYKQYLAGARQERLTWAMFYAEFERIVGRRPEFKHTQKQFQIYGGGGRAFFAMTGRRKPYDPKPTLSGDWKVRHREAQQKFLQDRTEYRNLQSLISDLKERISG